MYAIGTGAAASQSAAEAENLPGGAETALSRQAPDPSRYAGLMDRVRDHREAQVKMVKKWREIKATATPSESMLKEYKALQVGTQEAADKVSRFIAQPKWTDEDRKAMNQLWADELAKDIT